MICINSQTDWQQLEQRVIYWRRQLHQYPELSHVEYKTTDFLKQLIGDLFPEITILTPAQTGVVARLQGHDHGPVIALRTDIDALPVQEMTGTKFASRIPGVMHACGHDAHTAMLLGAMCLFYAKRQMLPATLLFIFQRGEEMSPGGAKELVASGCINDANMFFALHLDPLLPAATIRIKPDIATANRDTFTIVIQGKGGHSSMPQQCHDALVAGGHVICALQSIVAREIDPAQTAVISLCSMIAGDGSTARLPDSARLCGVVRNFSPAMRQQLREAITRIAQQTSAAFRCQALTEFADWDYQAIVNDEHLSAIALRAARHILPAIQVIQATRPMCVGEDFSEYQHIAPVCFAWLGAGRADTDNAPLHSGYFSPDERTLIVGVKYYCELVQQLLNHQK